MNYTKFLHFKNSNKNKGNFVLSHNDEKIKMSMEMLKDIQKTLFIINNFLRIGMI